MKRAALTDYAIGYASMPLPPDTTREDARDDAISARIDEIWADANLLHYAIDDASIPLSLHTCTMLRDAARRINRQPNAPRIDAELVILGLVEDLHGAVVRAARHDIENPSRDP